MATVKAKARPWHAIFALVLAVAAGIISSAAGPAAHDGQQAGPAGLGLANSGQAGPAEKHQPAPGQQPPGGSSPQP